jgi:hypothetical protein
MREHCGLLDISVEISGPHDFAVRIGAARLASPPRPPHPAPNVRDDRETPLCGPGRGEFVKVICPTAQAHIFASRLNDQIRLNGFSNLRFWRSYGCDHRSGPAA